MILGHQQWDEERREAYGMAESGKKPRHKKRSGVGASGVFCILAGLALLFFAGWQAKEMFFPDKKQQAAVITEQSSVKAICELATLRSYYHNVAVFEKDADPIFRYGLAQVGAKKMWMEYSGIVELVVDAGKIVIHEPDADGVVRVYVPDAVVKNVTADKESLSDPLIETGWFTEVTAEEMTAAFSEAQTNMKQEAENDQMLLDRAKENAKKLLEQYIINTGKGMGEDYTVRWLSAPE